MVTSQPGRQRKRLEQFSGTPPSRAELETLTALCQPGASRASVAHKNGITIDAVKGRMRRLYWRLGVNSDAQAAYAIWGPKEDRRPTN